MIFLKSALSLGIFDKSWVRLSIARCCSWFFAYRKLSHWNIRLVSLLTLAKEAASRLFSLCNCTSVFGCLMIENSPILHVIIIPIYINISFFGTILGILWDYFGNVIRIEKFK